MTKEECKELITTIQTSIAMTDVSREAKTEAMSEVRKILVKKIKKEGKNER